MLGVDNKITDAAQVSVSCTKTPFPQDIAHQISIKSVSKQDTTRHNGCQTGLSGVEYFVQNYLCVMHGSETWPMKTEHDFESYCFTSAAPTIWNSLSVTTMTANSIGTFRSRLKTDLFAKAYAA